MEEIEIVREVLDVNNYAYWSDLVRTYLIAQDLWDVVESSEEAPKPEEDQVKFKSWKKKNAAALHAIKISCHGGKYFDWISTIPSAKTAWDALASMLTIRSPYAPFTHHENYSSSNPSQDQVGAETNTIDDEESAAGFFLDPTNDDWEAALEDMFDRNPGLAATVRIPQLGNFTSLHLAVIGEQLDVLEEMMETIPSEGLEVKDSIGLTALDYVLGQGLPVPFAKCMLTKNPKLASIPGSGGQLPVTAALILRNICMAEYLYSLTPLEDLLAENAKEGATILSVSLDIRYFDIALDLLGRCPSLGVVKDFTGNTLVNKFASVPCLLDDVHRLTFWKRWICNYCIRVQEAPDFARIRRQVEDEENKQSNIRTIISSVWGTMSQLASSGLKLSGIKQLHERKLTHVRSSQILHYICKISESLDNKQMIDGHVYNAMWLAAVRGNSKFLLAFGKVRPELWRVCDPKLRRNLFMHAVQHRRGDVFTLLYMKNDMREAVIHTEDKYKNNLLHVAGMLPASTQLDSISGAVLQMQSELQWFKEVEKIVPAAALTSENFDGMTPREVFTMNHKDLVIEGEKWMKETATACIVVGALIATIMFSAAFTLPGGNKKDSGLPIFRDEWLFKLFIFSDAISLFSSTTSVLTFLGLFTSRYDEEDFLKSLPTKLIIGLLTLFLSIATMMVAYCVTLLIMLRQEMWIVIPANLFGSLPVLAFVVMQFPLLVEIFISTYLPSNIVNRNMIKTMKDLL